MTPLPTTYPNEQPEHPYVLTTMAGKLFGNFASHFCAGCGYGVIVHLFTKVFEDLKLNPLKHPLVIGIGCYTQMLPTVHGATQKVVTLHGRAPALLTGMKLANPSLKPILMTGDGDCLGIGGNHFIHLCKRNVDCTLLLFNNAIYGMTGGQVAPTTPPGYRTSTTLGSVFERPMDGVKLALAAGASHVARITVAHPRTFMKYLKKGLMHRGTSVIEVITPCVTYFGRKNADDLGCKLNSGGKMLEWIGDNVVWKNQAEIMSRENLRGKWVIGEFRYDPDVPEYASEYEKVKARAMEE